jgi:hypothetical protein
VAISAVQRVSKGFSGALSCSIGSGDGWATPTSGNLIVLTVNGDQTFSTPSGYTAGPSVVDDNAVYLFWKISAGTETTPTITPAGTTTAVMTACEYSGVAASPADGSNTSSIVNAVGTTTTSTSVTTTADLDEQLHQPDQHRRWRGHQQPRQHLLRRTAPGRGGWLLLDVLLVDDGDAGTPGAARRIQGGGRHRLGDA